MMKPEGINNPTIVDWRYRLCGICIDDIFFSIPEIKHHQVAGFVKPSNIRTGLK